MRASFRDPRGRVLRTANRVLRVVDPVGARDLGRFMSSSVALRLTEAGLLVSTRSAVDAEVDGILSKLGIVNGVDRVENVVEHERIEFPSFPYEWSPGMLFAAAELTLELAVEVNGEGFGLKDATPDNVLFRGPDPVFVDLLSFEPRDGRDPTWLAYAQFVRTFLLPLLVNKNFDLPLNLIFLANRDGLTPEFAYQMCTLRHKVSAPFLSLVTIPKLLGGRRVKAGVYGDHSLQRADQAQFVLSTLFKRLRRQLNMVKPSANQRSEWTEYAESTGADYVTQKRGFVVAALAGAAPRHVLDVGCNTGDFSEIAAAAGADVVSIDTDPQVIDRLWSKARENSLKILPLVVDIARPSPPVGWRNNENASFIDRATGHFDTVLMLAVVHHLLVTDRIPLHEIFRLAAELTTDNLIIEYVSPEDEMFHLIARGRGELHTGLTREVFELAAAEQFRIISVEQTPRPTRWLYHLRKHSTSQ